jgi:hypothetical protein
VVFRVDAAELVDTLPHGDGLVGVSWRGELFTGVAVETHPDRTLATETPYEGGAMHGRCTSYDRTGRLVREHTMEHGMFLGEDRAWWPSGALRWHRVRGPHPKYREQQWNEAGVLVLDRDDVRREQRAYYDDGTPRLERMSNVTRRFARDGQLLSTTTRVDGDVTRWEQDAMEAHLFEVLADGDVWYMGLAFLRQLVSRDRPRGIAQMRRVLAGTDGLAKIDVAHHAAELQLAELAPDLEALLSDDTVPPAAINSRGGSRSSTLSVGRAARKALARLRRR